MKTNLFIKALVLAAFFLSACKPPSDNNSPCVEDFEKSVSAEIKGSKLYIPIKDLEFLFKEKNLVIEDIDLIVTIMGRDHEKEDIELDINGLKVSKRDGHRHLERMDYDHHRGHCRGSFKLHKFFLHGAEPFHLFIKKIRKHKGDLVIQLHSRRDLSKKIVEVKLVFKGKIKKPNCEQPSPTPTPPPIDPATYAAQITSTNPAVSPTSSSDMLINFSAQNSGGSFRCSLDGASPSLCQSPISYSGLSNGIHNFQVQGVTPNGVNAGVPASYSWEIDAVAPSVTIDNASSLPALSNQNQISFIFSSIEPGTFECSLDGSPLSSCASPNSYSNLAEGTHQFQVFARDSLGNVSSTPASFQWVIDLTAPIVSFIDVSPSEIISKDDFKNFTFAANESASFECALDNGPFGSCYSPVALTSLGEGNHWFEVRATDLAGNVGLATSYAWQTDYTAPNIVLGSVQPAAGLSNASNISVEFSADESVEFYCAFDGASAEICSSPYAQSNLAEGSHDFSVYAVDAAGNQSSAASVNWVLDFTAPVISFGQFDPSNAQYLNAVNFTIEINNPENINLGYMLNGVSFAGSNAIDLSNLVEGSYSLEVSGVDSAGNASNSLSHSFVIDRTAPVISIQASGSDPTNIDSKSFEFFSDESVSYECNIDNMGFAPCSNVEQYAGLADGQHLLEVRGLDLAGNMGQASYGWLIDSIAPITSLEASQSGNVVNFSLSSNEQNVTFICSMDNAPFVSCSSNPSYTLSPGAHTFVAKAVDSVGNVDPVGAVMDIDVLAIQTFINSAISSGSDITITFSSSQQASDYQCSLDGAAFSSCSPPMSYSGLADGSHSFVVKAVDMNGYMDPVGVGHSWVVDTAAPVPANIVGTPNTNSIVVTWTTNEPSTQYVRYGLGSSLNLSTAENSSYTTSHSVTITGLVSNTLYSFQVAGRDANGNAYLGPVISIRTRR